LANKIVSRETNKINMENLSSCPVCGKTKFTLFLQSIDFFLTKEEFTIVICASCGMKFVNPRPDSTEISKYYESLNYVSHGGKKNILNYLYKIVRNYSIRKKYKLVKKYARNQKLLDIGCGTGEFISFCNQMGFDVKGIEPGEKPRSFAKTKYKLDVQEESYFDNIIGAEFDIITMWHVLEHVHLLHERMNKIREILKPDGTLIIAVPNSDSWDAGHYGKFWAAYDLPRHLYNFSSETMKILAEAHQLKIDKIIPMKLDAFYISLLSEKYAKGNQNYFKAVINGIRSNTFANKNKKNYSSLIYILKKEKTENYNL
jgi:2-polyprenyl-3-methyl-5-hydroxy-6-metoxy-1,4-benzoquinol methylase